MVWHQPLNIAYTPDSDDAFYYFALETGKIPLPGYRVVFFREPMSILNCAALNSIYEVTGISSVVYPSIADRYAILSVGTSVGRGYGPVLVSKRWHTLDELQGRRVGVGGIPTTGWLLLRSLCPEAVPVELPFDRIADAVAVGDLDAGVMIHEELLYYPRLGLHKVIDLGNAWCERNKLPLPVGLNVIRLDLGDTAMQQICTAIRCSLLYGLGHRQEALTWVSRFGRGAEACCTQQFVEMFANQDSISLLPDVREALHAVCCEAVELGVGKTMPCLDIVEGAFPATPPALARTA